MDAYTRQTRDWLNERFRRGVDEGRYLAHQPIYGFGRGPTEATGHVIRMYARTFSILRELNRLRFDSLLDVGGAEGYQANLIRRQFGAWTVSCDLSSEACHRAEELYALPAVAADSPALPFPDDSFDVVLCSEVLEHVEHPIPVVLELRRIARKAVIITIMDATCSSRERELKLRLLKTGPHEDRNVFTGEDFRLLLGDETQLRSQACKWGWPRSDRREQGKSRDEVRRILRRITRRTAFGIWSSGLVAVRHFDPGALLKEPRFPEEQLLEAILHQAVEPGARQPEAEIEPRLRDLLVCPACRGRLEWAEVPLCPRCQVRYNRERAVPILYPPDGAPSRRESLASRLRETFGTDTARAGEARKLAAKFPENVPRRSRWARYWTKRRLQWLHWGVAFRRTIDRGHRARES